MMNRFKFLTYISTIFVLFAAGCFEERDHSWANEVLEWEPPDRSTNALSMTVDLEDDETETQVVSLRMQYAGEQKSEDMTGTFVVDEQNTNAVEGEHFRILNESNSVTIPANSSYSEEIEIEVISGAIERGEEFNIVLLITGDGDIPPMENYKEFNLFVAKETGFLPVTEVTFDNPGSNSGERMLDAVTGQIYTFNAANADPGIQEQIDIGMWHSGAGQTTRHTMIVPTDDDRLGGWGSGRTIRDDWPDENKNDGVLIKLPFEDENQELFDNVLTAEDLRAAYENAEETVADLGLDQHDYGPGGHVHHVDAGEIVFFRSLDRDFYAVLIVDEAEISSSGFVTFSMKTTVEEEN